MDGLKKKLMLVTNELDPRPNGGRELLCKINYDALRALYKDSLVLFELPSGGVRGARALFNALRGHIDGLNTATLENALAMIEREGVQQVFVDGSNLGALVSLIKKRFPSVEVTTFFHNVEARFAWGSLLMRKTPRALAVLLCHYLAERKAVRSSDKIICLSDRDSCMLRRIYNRPSTHIAPMALEDKCPASFTDGSSTEPESFALFVGVSFYANQAGIAWFVREVVPRINLPIYIVGRGFEALRSELEVPGKVVVIGAVESISDWYRRSKFVIAPIFDGSGMKTKVAEALMYGKKIIGTPEAFSGYEEISGQAGWVCKTADEFVGAIEMAQKESNAFDLKLRELFLARHSFAAARARLSEILSSPSNASA